MDEDVSTAAALLTAGLIARNDLTEMAAFRTWQRQRQRILTKSGKPAEDVGSVAAGMSPSQDDSAVFEAEDGIEEGDQDWSSEDDSSSVWFPSSAR
jgi:hypothetical protein